MASTTDVRYIRYLWRAVLWVFAAGIAAFIGMLMNAGHSSAQPVAVPDSAAFDVPEGAVVSEGLVRNFAILPAVALPVVSGIEHPAALNFSVIEQSADFLPMIGLPAPMNVPAIIPVPMEAPAILPAPMNTPAIELPVPMGVPAIELPAWLDDVPGIELPFLDELPLVDFPFPFGAPENIPWSPTPPGVVMPEKTPGEVAVEAARSKLGATYSYGAVGPDSFDCSGLVQWSYMQADVDLPRTSYAQVAAGTPVPLDQLRPGDVVSFYGGDHSALYAGDGEVIHASTYGVGVTVSPISSMPVSGACRF